MLFIPGMGTLSFLDDLIKPTDLTSREHQNKYKPLAKDVIHPLYGNTVFSSGQSNQTTDLTSREH